jgi:hypothetical protein
MIEDILKITFIQNSVIQSFETHLFKILSFNKYVKRGRRFLF